MTDTAGNLEADGARLAWRRTSGRGPTLLWLGGFRSEMSGTKAEALAAWASANGRDFLRFDYFGHGVSSGDFESGTISRWRADALAVLDRLTEARIVLVGSSMGGWLACLAALARPERIAGLLLVAPAADFVGRLLAPSLPRGALETIRREGVWRRPSPYDPAGDPITRQLLEDGAGRSYRARSISKRQRESCKAATIPTCLGVMRLSSQAQSGKRMWCSA